MRNHLKTAERITNLLENKFSLFGYRFGFDPILGLFPGVGDFIPFLLSAYMVWIGARMGLPAEQLGRMVTNVVLDVIIGFIPLLGDLGDFAFKANSRNLAILKEFADPEVLEGTVVEKSS
jgi:hypothetical protein